MLSTTMRTGSSSFFDSILWWTFEAVIASTEITSDGEIMPYICVHTTNISPNKIFLLPLEVIHYLKQKLTYN